MRTLQPRLLVQTPHAAPPFSPPLATHAAALLLLRGGMSTRQGWAVLAASTAFELLSTAFMHLAQGFTRPVEAALACVFYGTFA